ncbi:MAG: type I-E CRISPR-associated protein Cas5/CasD [Oscillospiraceae bacterium]|jgi:CRISPR system Cascade subunit CasD|nr:type I-E CRISPR-associated protein Cas5/CasD [Oscillospiraceae bacterium]
MSTLLLRLAAPLQSWGADSKFEERRGTVREPTKSGVIGMLAAALGRERENPIDDLAELKFGVRVDQPGQLLKDFHTARIVGSKAPYVTKRHYLADAVFLVGLEGDDGQLFRLDEAIQAPVFPLFLGRRSCPPVGKISLGISDKSLKDALHDCEWQACQSYKNRIKSLNEPLFLTVVIDSQSVGNYRRCDVPLSFSQRHRKHQYRYLDDNPKGRLIWEKKETEHDAMEAFGEVIQDVSVQD